jgi:uncharacterized membrane protein
MWYIFALLSAVFASVRKTNEKQLSHKLNHFTIGWSIQLLSLPIILVALFTMGKIFNPFELGLRFWLPTLFIWIGFYPLNNFLTISALKEGELSKIMPLQSLAPIFGLLLAWLLIGQRPTIIATLGIAITVVGVYVLNLKGRYLHNPLKIFTADKANLYTLCAILLYTLAGVLDTIAIKASEPIYYCFVSTAGAVVVLFITSLLFKIRELHNIKQNISSLSVAGTMFGLSYAAYLLAISTGPLAYVTALRTSTILLSTMGVAIYLRESITRVKIFALILIGTGSMILVLN